MAEAAAVLRPFGFPLRRCLGTEDGAVIGHSDIELSDQPHWQDSGLLLMNDWDVTTSCSVPDAQTIAIPHFDWAHGSAKALDKIQIHMAAPAYMARTALGACYGWIPAARNIKWLSLLGTGPATESAQSAIALLEGVGEVALTKIGEIAWATSGPELAELQQYLSTCSKLPYAKELAARIQELEQDLFEEAENETISAVSLFSLIRFLETNEGLKEPGIAVGNGGQLSAKWTGPQGREIIIHFRATGGTQLYGFVPDQAHPEKMDVLSASPSLEALPHRLEQLEIIEWMSK